MRSCDLRIDCGLLELLWRRLIYHGSGIAIKIHRSYLRRFGCLCLLLVERNQVNLGLLRLGSELLRLIRRLALLWNLGS